MQIQSQTQATDPTQLANTTSTTQAPAASSNIDALANENTFLQLLVAQIKNQDPTNPTDAVQFLSQLAQFSQLEQLIGIRQELQPYAASTSTTNQSSSTTGAAATTN
jgi:flagellar basal-body rod modification protein FlgD